MMPKMMPAPDTRKIVAVDMITNKTIKFLVDVTNDKILGTGKKTTFKGILELNRPSLDIPTVSTINDGQYSLVPDSRLTFRAGMEKVIAEAKEIASKQALAKEIETFSALKGE